MARMQDCSSEHSRSEKIGAVPPQVACNLGSHGLLWWHDVKFWESIICKAPMTCNATSNAGEVLQFNVGRGVLLLDLGATPDAPGYPTYTPRYTRYPRYSAHRITNISSTHWSSHVSSQCSLTGIGKALCCSNFLMKPVWAMGFAQLKDGNHITHKTCQQQR